MARELASRGLGLGDRLLLREDNSPEWVATFLGCLMRGVVVVPLDVQSSPEFVAGIERQTQPKLVLGGGPGASLEELPSPSDSLAAFCRSAASHPPTPDWSYAGKVTGDHLAEIVFTSGTTAAPKGIRLTHRNLLANLTPLETEIRKYVKWAAPVHPIRFLSLLPLSHVFGQMMGIFVPPLLGGQALFLNTLNPSEIIAAIRRERISVLATVPRILELLRDKVERDEASRNPRTLAGRPVRPQCPAALAASMVDLSPRPPPIRLEVLGLPFGRGGARLQYRGVLEKDGLCRHAGVRNDRNGGHHQPCPPLSTRPGVDRQTHARPGDQAGRRGRDPGAGPQHLTRLLGGGGRSPDRRGGLAANRGPGATGCQGETSISAAGARK